MWIFVCGPWRGDGADEARLLENQQTLNRAALAVFGKGHTPIIGINMALPMAHAADDPSQLDAIRRRLSRQLMERCDACLRIGGPSPGADAEAGWFRAKGLPVFAAADDVPSA
jgi:hypothetical protein